MEERFARLERQVRRWRALTAAMVGLAGIALLTAAARPNVVRATRLELLDPQGRPCASLSWDGLRETPVLRLSKGDRELVATPWEGVRVANGGGAIELHVDDVKGPFIHLRNADDQVFWFAPPNE